MKPEQAAALKNWNSHFDKIDEDGNGVCLAELTKQFLIGVLSPVRGLEC